VRKKALRGGDGALEALDHLGGIIAVAGLPIELLFEMGEDEGVEEGRTEDIMRL
jgi:hypothetical protein